MRIVFDIETDGLMPEVSKIHVFSWLDLDKGGEVQSTNNHKEMQEVLDRASVVIGHNIIAYDLPVLKMFGVYTNASIIDTLPLSWYLFPSRGSHGLDAWGKTLGIEKPKIDDWESLDYYDYKHRCEEDVKINNELYKLLDRKLHSIYRDVAAEKRLVNYLNFKMTCAHDQEVYGWRLDVEKAKGLHDKLQRLKAEAEGGLVNSMPTKPITKVMNPPKVMYRKDGTLSARGEAWQEALRDAYLPATTNQPITLVVGEEPGNPNSPEQVKGWLYSLGWKPTTFKFVRDAEGERKIAQVRDGSDLCQSVVKLIDDEPSVKYLEDLTILTHRLGIVKGFLDCVDQNGKLVAGISGLTNTLRFKHRKPLVNLPGVDRPWGEEIRGCLIAGEGKKLIGCDMVSLEDTTKRHYMQPIDPEYVEEMQKEGFDPHLDLAKHAGEISQMDIDEYNEGLRPELKKMRKAYKAANYACVYGVGPQTLSRSTGLALSGAKMLIKAYWLRNSAVRAVAESRRVFSLGDETWIYNDVSGFWYNLRVDKDRWSTTNQSTGVYVFDTFVRLIKKEGLKVIGQFHDEVIIESDDTGLDTTVLDYCCEKLNAQLELNVPIGIDYSVGNNYSDVH